MMGRLATATLGAAILEFMSAATYRASKQCKQPRLRQDMDGIVQGDHQHCTRLIAFTDFEV